MTGRWALGRNVGITGAEAPIALYHTLTNALTHTFKERMDLYYTMSSSWQIKSSFGCLFCAYDIFGRLCLRTLLLSELNLFLSELKMMRIQMQLLGGFFV